MHAAAPRIPRTVVVAAALVLAALAIAAILTRFPGPGAASASSHSESLATVMLVFPAVKLEARSCGQNRLFCLRCCANLSKP